MIQSVRRLVHLSQARNTIQDKLTGRVEFAVNNPDTDPRAKAALQIYLEHRGAPRLYPGLKKASVNKKANVGVKSYTVHQTGPNGGGASPASLRLHS